MTEFVEELFSFISNAATSAGTRFYPNSLRQNVVLPACRYFRVSNPQDHSHSGVSALNRPRFQIDCYGSTYLAAVQLAKELQVLLDGYRGSMGTHKVSAAFMEDAGKDDHDPETGRHRVGIDIVIWHKES